MIKVLVFPCSTGVGIDLVAALGGVRWIEVIGAVSGEETRGISCYEKYFKGLPDIGDESFIKRMNTFIKNQGIDYIYPTHDDVVVYMAKNRDKFDCEIIVSGFESCEVARSKHTTYERLKSAVNVPVEFDGEVEYPVFFKLDKGEGSRGIFVAKDDVELEAFRALHEGEEYLMMEYLQGKEYTVDCFTDRNNEVLFTGARERVKARDGVSVKTAVVVDSVLEGMAKTISDKMGMRYGWFFQTKKREDGTHVLMEVGARLSGGIAVYRNAGVNTAVMSLMDAEGMDVSVLCNDKVLDMERVWQNRFVDDVEYNHVYVDYDDTMILRGMVNSELMMFLWQCRNKGKKIHLVTRAVGVYQDMENRGLLGMIDSLDIVTEDRKKSEFMEHRDSIFIDDSFAERRDVAAMGVPVFDVGAVECLIDWRK